MATLRSLPYLRRCVLIEKRVKAAKSAQSRDFWLIFDTTTMRGEYGAGMGRAKRDRADSV